MKRFFLLILISFSIASNAQTIFLYEDNFQSVKVVKEFLEIPDDARYSYAINTETLEVKIIKGRDASQNNPSKDLNLPDEVIAALKWTASQMKDPESALFSDVVLITLEDDTKLVGGFVNAKNSYGGYAGKRSFLYSLEGIRNPGLNKGSGPFSKQYDKYQYKELSDGNNGVIGENLVSGWVVRLKNIYIEKSEFSEISKDLAKTLDKSKWVRGRDSRVIGDLAYSDVK